MMFRILRDFFVIYFVRHFVFLIFSDLVSQVQHLQISHPRHRLLIRNLINQVNSPCPDHHQLPVTPVVQPVLPRPHHQQVIVVQVPQCHPQCQHNSLRNSLHLHQRIAVINHNSRKGNHRVPKWAICPRAHR